MSTVLQLGLANAACAAVLALLAYGAGRRLQRPALAHGLWLLVLIKLVTPPVVPLPVAWLPDTDSSPGDSDPSAATLAAAPGRTPTTNMVFERSEMYTLVGGTAALPAGVGMAPVAGEWRSNSMGLTPEAGSPAEASFAGTGAIAGDSAESEIPPAPPRSVSLSDAAPWLLGVWLAGSVAAFAWAVVQVARFQRLLRHARPAPVALQEQARGLARKMGLRRCPDVYLLPGPLPPLVWASPGAPRVFFPAGLLDRLDEQGRAALLAHELAHVCRRDHLVRWLELLVVGLYWWYPLVWWARRKLQACEEECCDAWVVGEMPARVYAGAILETVDFLAQAPPGLPALASGLSRVHALKLRLTLIMEGRTPKRLTGLGRVGWLALAAVLLPLVPTLARAPRSSPKAEAANTAESAPVPEQPEESLTFTGAHTNLIGRNNEVFSLALSADGEMLASGGGYWDRPGEIKVWALAKRTTVKRFRTRLGVCSVAFSPGGKLLASGGYDHLVVVRDLSTDRELYTVRLDAAARVAFSPDGKRLAAASEGQTVKLWETDSGKEVFQLKGDLCRFHCVGFSRDGQLLAAGGGDWNEGGASMVTLWDSANGKQTARLDHPQPVLAVCFAPDRQTLATGGLDGAVRLWDLRTKQVRLTLAGHEGWVEGLAFSPDGKQLASTSHDQTVRLWDLALGQQSALLGGHDAAVRSAVFSKDGKRLVTGGGHQALKLWDPALGKEVAALQTNTDRPETMPAFLALACSRDGKTVALATEDRTVQVRDLATGDLRSVLEGHTDAVTSLALSPDGKTLATGSADKRVKLWDVETGKERATLEGHGGWVYAVEFSPDGKTLASAGFDRTVRLWDLATNKEKALLKGHQGSVRALAFTPDGQTLASAGSDRTIRLWDVDTRKEKAALKGHAGTVRGLEFTVDGKLLASVSEDGTARLWDTVTGKESKVLKAEDAEFTCLTLSPRGTVLVAGRTGGTVQAWDTRTGQAIATLSGHGHDVTAVAFAPDGKQLITASLDHTVKLWPTQQAPRQP
jgi:WD40 repeat protein/beta-lactamase regulating signal transducer with metallopeptidase domain